jgi:hypothetical protein
MSDSNKSERNFISAAVCGSIVIAIVNYIWPNDVIPFKAFAFWSSKTNFLEWVVAGLPIFGWGLLIQTYLEIKKARSAFTSRNWLLRMLQFENSGDVFSRGVVLSLLAGIVEEIAFRWLIFLSTIVYVKVGNFLIFGWLGFGLAEWLHLNFSGPFVDWITCGYLHGYLFHPASWAVGAALLVSNAFFRDGHKYQGKLGYLNSWFLGMFFFWIMFSHGLPAAIVVHTLYDITVYTVAALSTAIRNRARSPFHGSW